jgi:hypothetical protein
VLGRGSVLNLEVMTIFCINYLESNIENILMKYILILFHLEISCFQVVLNDLPNISTLADSFQQYFCYVGRTGNSQLFALLRMLVVSEPTNGRTIKGSQ